LEISKAILVRAQYLPGLRHGGSFGLGVKAEKRLAKADRFSPRHREAIEASGLG
jgi:hypothetical protein